MNCEFNLLLSPHPDDLVYSAYSALSRKAEKNVALVFFNVSRFTRWRLNSPVLTTLLRTLEDKTVLSFVGIEKASYFFERDTSISPFSDITKNWASRLACPSKILCPLGVGGNPNHIQVRNAAIELWKDKLMEKPQLVFYEDLPYAAKTTDPDNEEDSIIEEISPFRIGRKLLREIQPLTSFQLKEKMLACKAYFSQTDYSELLSRFARMRGRNIGPGFAELFFKVNGS